MVAADQEDWPDPPPWPDTEGHEEASDQPLIECLDQLMAELQLIKNQAMPASCHKPSPVRDSSPPQHTQPWQLSREPEYPDREPYPLYATDAKPWRYQEAPMSQSPPPRASTYRAGYPPQQPPNQYQPDRPPPPPTAMPYAAAYAPRQPLSHHHPTYSQPLPHRSPYFAAAYTPLQTASHYQPVQLPEPTTEQIYRGPRPTIPNFSYRDPCEFARLKIALENLLPLKGTELFKYQILVDHLKFEEPKLIADSYLNSPTPYTDTMSALNEKYGQPHQIALKKIASVLDSPDVRRGDTAAFERFAPSRAVSSWPAEDLGRRR